MSIPLCAICQKPLKGVFLKDFFCHDCYKCWENQILSGAEWVRWCENDERKRRYEENKWIGRKPYPIYFESLEAYVEKVREI
ncbi:MAG: hypothetical protein L6N96_02985 [Candidatus Methylarchaceae archaeon HK02M2]|nr:hypothetical protein [Candidatus Methylarchaceae archaeon HK02M2]